MKVAIAGASGLIGSALVSALRAAGHDVLRLVRGAAAAPGEIAWDPAGGKLASDALVGVDAVVNLAGENVASGRWTAARRERIRRSRIETTETLVKALAAGAGRRPRVLVNASAIGYYGERGDDIVTEASVGGNGFLPDVCRAWEAAATQAEQLGMRTVLLRFGVVLAAEGGALAKMLPVFRAGLGGPLGAGEQWMSWVSLEDAVRVIVFAVEDPRGAGPINVVAPAPIRNAEFARVLGRVLHRPAAFRVPRVGLRLVFGRMADETVLMSTRAIPQRLSAWDFRFHHQELEQALRAVLK